MKQKEKIALTILVVLSLGLLSFVIIKKYRKPKNVLLLGGLDNRSGDLSISEQVELVKKGVSYSMSVEGFRYNNEGGIINTIINSKKEMYVVLFSAGCSKSKDVANALKQKGYNLEYMFIVEPYAKSSTTSQSVRDAVSMGVPMKNVIVGNSESTGLGVINNPTLTPSCSPKHWCSLTELGKIIN
jgi:3-dehydroquinate dehydratase